MADWFQISDVEILNLDGYRRIAHLSGGWTLYGFGLPHESRCEIPEVHVKKVIRYLKSKQAGPMLVAADWLEDHGQKEAAELLRKEFTP